MDSTLSNHYQKNIQPWQAKANGWIVYNYDWRNLNCVRSVIRAIENFFEWMT